MPVEEHPDWSVLLLGGPSGAGKSTAAKAIARRYGIPWLQVDDLRLALQWSRVSLPTDEETAALYFFDKTPDLWDLPPERLCDGLTGVGQAMIRAIEKVVDSHVATSEPIVLEGDGILPSLFARPIPRRLMEQGHVRAVFLVEPEEGVLYANMMARDRGIVGRAEAGLRNEARAKWLFGRWITAEARRHGLPVLEPRPWATLIERIIAASNALRQSTDH